ncbi:efflux RND transporter periplasmic adaptor subunit [Salinarimonas sp.]|uniref:efflux RND transporter periplasmic adaptor subunit n=1 Tax=Salinarimonas sp. TaxID=2766526 RepID=UPI00391AFAA1
MIKRLVAAIVLLALVGGGLVGFNLFRDRMIADFFANMPVAPSPVATVEAQPVSWQPAIDAIGTANAAQGVDLTVEAAGIVREIAFRSNTRVEAGDLLVRLDDTIQRAEVEAARTRWELDVQSLERARDLQARGAGTNVGVETAESAARASEAQLARALAVLEQRTVVAPFAGTIGLPRVDLGQFLSPGTAVATLQDLDTMRVDFLLPEQELPNVAIGQPVHVRIEGGASAYDGEIVGIDPRVDPSSRLFAVRASITETRGTLTPGQFVRIAIDLPREDGVIALPQTALISSLYGDFVYVVRPSEGDPERLEARQVFVEPGRRLDGRVEIRSGLEAGAVVVAAGQNRLSNGSPVTLSPTPASDRSPIQASEAAAQ